jgi:hypothetical protein
MTAFKELKQKNNKKKVLILGCGPSLLKIKEEYLNKISKEYIIATIKQSYNHFGNYSNFQFFNCNNVCRYPRKKAKFIVCSPNKKSTPFWGDQEIDMFYHMSSHPQKICQLDDIEEGFKEENMGKYWGPGIMLEIVLPFFYNLGVNEIITAGWDYMSSENLISHFYPEIIRKSFSNPGNLPYDGENKESIKNSDIINSFLSSKGVSLKCVESEDCFLHDSIERVLL